MPPAEALLATLRGRGLSVTSTGDRITVAPAGRLSDMERAEIRRLKPELLRLLTPSPTQGAMTALREAYRVTFRLTAEGIRGPHGFTQQDADEAVQVITALSDDVGPVRAAALLAEELRLYLAETGVCGLCGSVSHHTEQEDP